MKRPAVEITYRRSSVARPEVTCRNCNNTLPIGRSPRVIKTVHMKCDVCGETILIEEKK